MNQPKGPKSKTNPCSGAIRNIRTRKPLTLQGLERRQPAKRPSLYLTEVKKRRDDGLGTVPRPENRGKTVESPYRARRTAVRGPRYGTQAEETRFAGLGTVRRRKNRDTMPSVLYRDGRKTLKRPRSGVNARTHLNQTRG